MHTYNNPLFFDWWHFRTCSSPLNHAFFLFVFISFSSSFFPAIHHPKWVRSLTRLNHSPAAPPQLNPSPGEHFSKKVEVYILRTAPLSRVEMEKRDIIAHEEKEEDIQRLFPQRWIKLFENGVDEIRKKSVPTLDKPLAARLSPWGTSSSSTSLITTLFI